MKKVLITGTVAFDDIEAPAGSSGKIIGGAGTYIGLASSLFTQNLAIVSIIGEDFPEEEIKFLNDRGINTQMIEKVTRNILTTHSRIEFNFRFNIFFSYNFKRRESLFI